MVRYLCIVAREQPDLFFYLLGEFSQDREALVLLDRRRQARRRGGQWHGSERRQADRRCQAAVERDLHSTGFTITRLQPEAASADWAMPTGRSAEQGA